MKNSSSWRSCCLVKCQARLLNWTEYDPPAFPHPPATALAMPTTLGENMMDVQNWHLQGRHAAAATGRSHLRLCLPIMSEKLDQALGSPN